MRAHGQQVSGLPTSYRIICKTVICSVDPSALSNTTSRCCLAGFSVHASLIWYLPLPIQYGSALLLCSGLSVQASLVWNNLPPVQYGSTLPSVEDFSEAQNLFPSFNVCHFSTGAHKIYVIKTFIPTTLIRSNSNWKAHRPLQTCSRKDANWMSFLKQF